MNGYSRALQFQRCAGFHFIRKKLLKLKASHIKLSLLGPEGAGVRFRNRFFFFYFYFLTCRGVIRMHRGVPEMKMKDVYYQVKPNN